MLTDGYKYSSMLIIKENRRGFFDLLRVGHGITFGIDNGDSFKTYKGALAFARMITMEPNLKLEVKYRRYKIIFNNAFGNQEWYCTNSVEEAIKIYHTYLDNHNGPVTMEDRKEKQNGKD